VPHKYFSIEGFPTYIHYRGATTLPGVAPDLSRGASILCLHGSGGNGNVFAELMDRLAETHSPCAFDQPGHGRTGGLDSLGSIERMTDFTRSVLEKLGVVRPVLLGHSMGGAVALDYALRYPQELRAIILCSSAARFEITDELLDFEQRVTEGKERRAFRREIFSSSTAPDVMRRAFMEDMKTDPRARYGDLLACREWNAEARLEALALPCLVMVGEDELPSLAQQAELLASRIPGARKQVVSKAAHALPLEAPDALAEALLGFLSELET